MPSNDETQGVPIDDGRNWARLSAELAVLDIFLSSAAKQRSDDSRKRSLNPFQGVILDSDDILASLAAEVSQQSTDPKIEKAIRAHEELIETDTRDGTSCLGYLSSVLRLRRFEERCLVLALAPELRSKYGAVYAYLQDSVSRTRPAIDLAMQLFATHSDDRLAFGGSGALMRYRLLAAEGFEGHLPLSNRTLSLDDRVLGCLMNSSDIDPEIESWVSLLPVGPSAPRVPINPEMLEKTRTMARACFGEHRHPVFHLKGAYGVGRRALAETVCRDNQMPLVVANVRAGTSARDKAESMWRLGRESLLQPAAILVENFDDLLAEGAEGSLGSLLDAIHSFEPFFTFLSGTRDWKPPQGSRFLFVSVPCPNPGAEERMASWQFHLGGDHSLSSQDLSELANKFYFTDGQIRDCVETARSVTFWEGKPDAPLSASIVTAASRRQAMPNFGALARRVETSYGWDDLKLPISQKNQLQEITTHIQRASQVYDDWGFEKDFTYGRGVAALFEGVSGTGKTMAAGIIASVLGMDLYRIDLAGVVSKYIGETEKHINRIFDEAESCNVIPFIDEADALFGKRSEVKDSHDRYANIETAFLLQRIEDYRGTVILASNMKQNMDDAFRRRLRFVVHFPFPNDVDRQAIWERMFPEPCPLSKDIDFHWLSRRLKVSGGNIKNIAIRAAFLAAQGTGTVDMPYIIESAKREYDKMGRLHSPAEFEGWRKEVPAQRKPA